MNTVIEEKTEKKKRVRLITLCVLAVGILAIVISIVWAVKHHNREYHGYYVFCVDSNETKVQYERYTPKADGTENLIMEFLNQMQTEPKDISMKKAIPDNVSIDEYTLSAEGELSLYLDSAYGNYTGVNEILRRASIVKTLCQIPDVESVQFYVAGQPLTDSNSNAIGFMTADTFIDNTGGEAVYQQNAVLNIYFATEDGEALEMVPVQIIYDATIPLEQMTIEQLMKGPDSIKGIDKNGILPTIPDGTVLNSVTVKEHTCYVDFSNDFLDKREDILPEVAIYSVVNTLTELATVNKVQFSIDGEQVLLYNDVINFGEVFERNLDLVKE
ncbi:MAG: GerMN domain-containing protein [Lachnospiraceae bacterium]|nr:GerMN domain-containing protein [Lachnospiraceae bacterium]